VAQAAGALVALAGVALMMLRAGSCGGSAVRGSPRSVLLAVTLVLHIVHAASFAGLLVTGVTLALLLVERSRFGAATDRGSSIRRPRPLRWAWSWRSHPPSWRPRFSGRVGGTTRSPPGRGAGAMLERMARSDQH